MAYLGEIGLLTLRGAIGLFMLLARHVSHGRRVVGVGEPVAVAQSIDAMNAYLVSLHSRDCVQQEHAR